MFTKALLSIDLYAKNIHFTTQNKEKTSTVIGAIVSLLIYIGSFAIAVIYLIELITSSAPSTSLLESSYQRPPEMTISKDTLSFGFGGGNSELFHYRINYNDGTYVIQIPTRECQPDDFQHVSFTEKNASMLKGMICPAGNYSSVISGESNEDSNKSFISIEVISNEPIDINSEISFKLLFGGINYDPYSQLTFFSYGMDIREFTFNPSLTTNINCHLSYQTIIRNTNIMSNQLQTNTSIRVHTISKEERLKDTSTQSVIASITLLSSKKYFIYERRTLKLLEAMSIIGGDIYLLMIIGKAISFIFESTNYKLQVLNAVFDFSSLNKTDNLMIIPTVKIGEALLLKSHLNVEKTQNDKSLLKNSDIFPSLNFPSDNQLVNAANRKDLPKKTLISIDDNIEIKLKKMIALKRAREQVKKKLLTLSSLEILHLYCCCHLSRLFNYKKQVYLEKRKQIDSLMQLAYYFDKCLSIEKMQTVLLRKGPHAVLSLLSREMIENNNYNKPLSALINDQVSFESNVFLYLNKLKEANYTSSPIDKKVMKMINVISV